MLFFLRFCKYCLDLFDEVFSVLFFPKVVYTCIIISLCIKFVAL